MTANSQDALARVTSSSSKALLRVVILLFIAGAAIASRLFSVIRFESIIHEFDPWFNFRATKYLVANGFYKFWDWFDDRTWHPLGRVTGGTLYPGLMVTSGAIYHALKALTIPVDIRNICVMLAPACSGLTAFATYLLTNEMTTSPSAGLLAAVFMGIAPGYISRSVAGSYDNEAIAIFLLVFTFYLWIKALKLGSMLWGALCALFYGYMVASWGGYAFITCLLPMHAFVLVCMGRYSTRLYVSYTTWYALGTLASMQIPFVGFLPVKTSEHMPALGIFGFLQLVGFIQYIRSAISGKQFQTFVVTILAATFGLGLAGLVALTSLGYVAPWSGRFYSLWDTSYAKIHIPIIASVSEHQPTAWPAFFFDLNMLIWLFPAGVYLCFQNLKDEHVFIVVYALFGSYFAGVMVRLMLTLTPVVCVAAAMAVSQILDAYLVLDQPIPEEEQIDTTDGTSKKATKQSGLRSMEKPVVGIFNNLSKSIVTGSMTIYLLMFVTHCTWVTSNAYSSPSVVLASRMPDGSQHIIDDYREAYQWLRQNTKEDAKIMSWWDYGYQIGGMADRPTLVDNNTWNNTHIATVGKAMSSSEEVSYPIMRQHEVDYVLIVFGGLLGYSGDDINKFLWMVRIAEGIWPDEVRERDFFTARGEYKVDHDATETMKNSLMYKMSYYNYHSLFPAGQVQDRVRGVRLPDEGPVLNTLEEAYTSENWIIRIYKVKDLDNVGREHAAVASFDKGLKKKKALKKRASPLRCLTLSGLSTMGRGRKLRRLRCDSGREIDLLSAAFGLPSRIGIQRAEERNPRMRIIYGREDEDSEAEPESLTSSEDEDDDDEEDVLDEVFSPDFHSSSIVSSSVATSFITPPFIASSFAAPSIIVSAFSDFEFSGRSSVPPSDSDFADSPSRSRSATLPLQTQPQFYYPHPQFAIAQPAAPHQVPQYVSTPMAQPVAIYPFPPNMQSASQQQPVIHPQPPMLHPQHVPQTQSAPQQTQATFHEQHGGRESPGWAAASGTYAKELQQIQKEIDQKMADLAQQPNNAVLRSGLRALQNQLNSTLNAAIAKQDVFKDEQKPSKSSEATPVEEVAEEHPHRMEGDDTNKPAPSSKQETQHVPHRDPNGPREESPERTRRHHLCSGCGSIRTFQREHSILPGDIILPNYCTQCMQEVRADEGLADTSVVGMSVGSLPLIKIVTTSENGDGDSATAQIHHTKKRKETRHRAEKSGKTLKKDSSHAKSATEDESKTKQRREAKRARSRRPEPLKLDKSVPSRSTTPAGVPASPFCPDRSIGSAGRRAERGTPGHMDEEYLDHHVEAERPKNYRPPYVEEATANPRSRRGTPSPAFYNPKSGRSEDEAEAATSAESADAGNVKEKAGERPYSSSSWRKERDDLRNKTSSRNRNRSADSASSAKSSDTSFGSSESKTVRFKKLVNIRTPRSPVVKDEFSDTEVDIKPDANAGPRRPWNSPLMSNSPRAIPHFSYPYQIPRTESGSRNGHRGRSAMKHLQVDEINRGSERGTPSPGFTRGAFSRSYGAGLHEWENATNPAESRASTPKFGSRFMSSFDSVAEEVAGPWPDTWEEEGQYTTDAPTAPLPFRASGGMFSSFFNKPNGNGSDREEPRTSPNRTESYFNLANPGAYSAFTDAGHGNYGDDESQFQSDFSHAQSNPYYEASKRRTPSFSPNRWNGRQSTSSPWEDRKKRSSWERSKDLIPEPTIEEASSVCSSPEKETRTMMLEYNIVLTDSSTETEEEDEPEIEEVSDDEFEESFVLDKKSLVRLAILDHDGHVDVDDLHTSMC
ncbi:hypothetical protein G7046_g8671 [Stylonectria norvegica]|nr:hypothetical protein G7046_g8671 [Stylonectria norvegica]